MVGKKFLKKHWWILQLLITIIVVIIISQVVGLYGVVGLIVVWFLYMGYRVWNRRDSVKMLIKTIEIMIWKKPLDKDMWDKGELKNTKVKLKWRKKN